MHCSEPPRAFAIGACCRNPPLSSSRDGYRRTYAGVPGVQILLVFGLRGSCTTPGPRQQPVCDWQQDLLWSHVLTHNDRRSSVSRACTPGDRATRSTSGRPVGCLPAVCSRRLFVGCAGVHDLLPCRKGQQISGGVRSCFEEPPRRSASHTQSLPVVLLFPSAQDTGGADVSPVFISTSAIVI